VPGPIGHPIFGNSLEMMRYGIIQFDKKNTTKYGKIFGLIFFIILTITEFLNINLKNDKRGIRKFDHIQIFLKKH
jgi:hypothetical protein